MISFFLALLPDKPRNLTVTNIKSRSAEISWLDPENTGDGHLTGFWIKLKKDNSLILNTTTNKPNKYEINNLTPYTTYEITVIAGNKYGFGEETITWFTTSEEGKNERCMDHTLHHISMLESKVPLKRLNYYYFARKHKQAHMTR